MHTHSPLYTMFYPKIDTIRSNLIRLLINNAARNAKDNSLLHIRLLFHRPQAEFSLYFVLTKLILILSPN